MKGSSRPEPAGSRWRWACQLLVVSAVLVYLLTYVCVRFYYRQMELVPEGEWYVLEISVPDAAWMPRLGEDVCRVLVVAYAPLIKLDERLGGEHVFFWRDELAGPREPAPP